MNYSIGQYNNINESLQIMSPVSQSGDPYEVETVIEDTGIVFKDPAVKLNGSLSSNNNYFLHCKIKRLNTEQTFYVKLRTADDAETKEQNIKIVTVKQGTGWFDLQIIFNPIINSFNEILFNLTRSTIDYTSTPRKPIVIFEELSELQNLLGGSAIPASVVLKLGVQAGPGLNMCINGEGVMVGNSGKYEVNNGKVYVTFFSIVTTATDIDIEEKQAENKTICLFNRADGDNRVRKVRPFTIDYIYEEGE